MPVKDRTEEFHKLRDMKGSQNRSPKHDKRLASLMKDVQAVEKQITALQNAIDQVESEQKLVVADVNMSKAKKKLEAAEKTARDASAQANKLLQRLGHDDDPAAGSRGDEDDPLMRMQDNHVKALTRRFIEQLNRFRTLQGEHMSKMKELLRRQLQIREDPDIEQRLAAMDELEQEQVFVDNIQVEMDDAVRSLDLCRVREQELLKMEGKITQVRDLFQEVHGLVHQQGETIDNIEANIVDAGGKIVAGNEQLVEARTSQKKARRCKIIVLVIVLIALGILAIILAVQYA